MVKDRTAEMVRIRDEAAEPRTQFFGIESFLKRTSEVEAKLKTMSEEITVMENIQKDLYLNPFFNEEDVKSMDVKNYEKACEQILATSNEIRKDIGVLKRAMYKCAQENPSSEDTESESHLKLKSVQLEFLDHQLSDLLNGYRKSQADYVDKTKSRLKRQSNIVQIAKDGYDNFSFDDPEAYIPERPSAIFIGDYLVESKKAIAELQELEDREKELKEVEKEIADMHKLFKEVNIIVGEQGETIDDIENNVEVTAKQVEAGVGHLKQAQQYRKSFLKRKTLLYVIILVVVVVLLIIIVVSAI